MAGSNSTQNGTVHNHNSSAVTANALIFDQCIIASQAAGEVEEEFNMPLKVSGIFIVLFISTLACMVPMFATRFTWIRLPKTFMFGARHFGTGVLIATAFCHLLPTAFLSLHDPCLPSFWISEYPAMPGAIAMGAVFLITCIEMMFSRGGAGSHSHAVPIELTARENPYLHGSASSRASTMSTDTLGKHGKTNAVDYSQDVEGSTMAASALAATKKAVLQCTLLEMGILFHSVFIGMSLSVIPNEEFVVLVAAIAFHQTFEGLALGSRIASINFPQHQRLKPWLMCMAYGATTPIGQALGIFTQSFYSQSSTVGILMVGIMNSISSGLLIYASLVELFAEDFLSEHAEHELPGKRLWIAFSWVFFGAFAMAFVGAYA